jgi:branched-chain amino acid transport system ATP-binding protein
MMVLRVNEIEVKMGLQQILRGISLAVNDKAIVTVLGSNGVGKTTLLKAISGIYRCAKGTIEFMGKEITNLPSHVTVKLGLCQAPEGRQMFSNMTVLENLKIGGYYRRPEELKKDMDVVYSLFPVLSERLAQKAGSLSGGEQQMLCIGRALMGGPKLMLMDEPSLGLAPILVKTIFDLFKNIRSQGTALLLVEQNAKAALRVADYAYVMEGGLIRLEGVPAEMAAKGQIEAAFLGAHHA